MLPSTDKTLAVLGDETEIKEKKKSLARKICYQILILKTEEKCNNLSKYLFLVLSKLSRVCFNLDCVDQP